MKKGGVKCCCGNTIGFDESAWLIAACETLTYIENIKNDISLLTQCTAVFGGNNVDCHNAIRFASGDWPELKDYVEGGGRLWIGAEWADSIIFPGNSCLQDKANLNAFLLAMDSTIVYVGEDNISSGTATAGAANIAQGIASFTYDRLGDLTGGTTVWRDHSNTNTIVAVEQLGDGFLFVSSDSNIYGFGNCNFFKRVWSWTDEDII